MSIHLLAKYFLYIPYHPIVKCEPNLIEQLIKIFSQPNELKAFKYEYSIQDSINISSNFLNKHHGHAHFVIEDELRQNHYCQNQQPVIQPINEDVEIESDADEFFSAIDQQDFNNEIQNVVNDGMASLYVPSAESEGANFKQPLTRYNSIMGSIEENEEFDGEISSYAPSAELEIDDTIFQNPGATFKPRQTSSFKKTNTAIGKIKQKFEDEKKEDCRKATASVNSIVSNKTLMQKNTFKRGLTIPVAHRPYMNSTASSDAKKSIKKATTSNSLKRMKF